jgi:hypothetical protein
MQRTWRVLSLSSWHLDIRDFETLKLRSFAADVNGPGKAMLGSARECPILTWTSEKPRLHVRSRPRPLVPSRGRRSGHRSRTRRPRPPRWVVGGAGPGPCPSPKGAQGNRGRPRREGMKEEEEDACADISPAVLFIVILERGRCLMVQNLLNRGQRFH